MAKKDSGSKGTQGSKAKSAKKLKVTKLEERIAPSMIGGGIVDPGTIDAPEDSPEQTDSSSGQVQSTTIEGTSSTADAEGQYVNESSNTSSIESDGGDSGSDSTYQSNAGMEDLSGDASAGYVEETPAWQEADWVTANADGSMDIALPEGASVDNGVASFPVDVANESLPLPTGVELQADGSVNVALPEGASFDPAAQAVSLPADSPLAQEIPAGFESYSNPDGTLNVALPETGVSYDTESNTLTFTNECANELCPSNVEISSEGSVEVTLPEGVQVGSDGSIEMSAEQAQFMDNPAPEYVAEGPEWVEANADGSVSFEPPKDCIVDAAEGTLTMSVDACQEHFEEQIPEDMTLNADGTMDYKTPEGTQYDAETRLLTLPGGEVGDPNHIPPEFNAHVNEDGTCSVTLPQGVDYNAENGAVHFDNHWTNVVAQYDHPNVEITPEGQVQVDLPQGTEYHADGSFTVPAEYNDFVEAPQAPDYVMNGPDWTEYKPDGSVEFAPPTGVVVDPNAGMISMSVDGCQEHFENQIPEEMTLNSDGTMTYKLPEGCEWNAEAGTLQLPPGEIENPQEIPAAFAPVVAEDGSVTVSLPPGVEYDPASGSVEFNNYWTNEIAQTEYPQVEITPDGQVQMGLPPGTEYHSDGSFTVPAEHADFVADPAPDYVMNGPDWTEYNPDGSVTFQPPAAFEVNPDAGTMTAPVAAIVENFDDQIPEDFTLNADGTLTYQAPTDANWDAQAGTLTLPPGEIPNPQDIPVEFQAQVGDDGAVTLTLPEGVTFDEGSGNVKFDNYWTNELTQMQYPQVEISPEGQVEVALPPDTHYFENGAFTVPEAQADFLADPVPEFVANGPEWVDCTASGAITVDPPEGCVVNPDAGTLTMPIETALQSFDEQIPEELTINPDGTMSYELPEGSRFDSANGMLTLPPDTIQNVAEIPDGFNAIMADNGAVMVTLPPGVEYDPAEGALTFDNHWTNELVQAEYPAVEITPAGEIEVALPEGTAYYPDGSLQISAPEANFLDAPAIPEVVASGPDWAAMNPDGSVEFEPAAGFTVDPNAGTLVMSADLCHEHFDGQIPEEITLNSDGTMTYQVPETAEYNAEAGTLTLPAGEIPNPEQIPAAFAPIVAEDGSITVTLPPGVEYDSASSAVEFDNYWTNEIAQTEFPQVEISENGQVELSLPPGTEYQADGSFTVPPEHADFVNDPAPDYVMNGPDWASYNPDGSVSFLPPPEFQINPEEGVMTAPVAAITEHFEEQIPEDVTFNGDGTMNIDLPEGVTFDSASRELTLPAGEMHDPSGVPPAFNGHLNEDGSFTVTLPTGCDYDAAAGSVHFDTYWTNEIVQMDHHNIEVTPEGQFQVQLPPGTQYFEDGSFAVAPQHADFVDAPAPDYVMEGPAWTSYNSDGSVTVTPPEGVKLDPQAGTLTMSIDYANANFDPIIPEDMVINPDGSVVLTCPEGCQFNAESAGLTFPSGEFNPNDVPAGIEWEANANGTYTVTLPEGITYDTANNSVLVSNEWVNQIAPEPITISTDGTVSVSLPPDTEYFPNGTLMIPADQVDFLSEGSTQPQEGDSEYQKAVG